MALLIDAGANPPSIIDPTSSAGSGFETLFSTPLNQAIAQANNVAGSSRRRMSFLKLSDKLNIFFSLNPQQVLRRKNVVEAEFPTMNAWHTYRWMEEPTLWQIAGYGGLLGPNIIDYIAELDGEDNVLWDFPYVGVNAKSVKIISTDMPFNAQAPYSFNYTITLRENEAVVLNEQSDQWGVQRLADAFTNLTYTIPIQSQIASTYPLNPDSAIDHSLSTIAQNLIAQHKSTLKVDDQITYMSAVNKLKVLDWPNDKFPTDSDNQTVTVLYYNAGS